MAEAEEKALPEELGKFRSYLLVLARTGFAEDLRAKLDPSDVVQQTLLEAHRDKDQLRGKTAGEQAGWLRAALAHNLVNAGRDLRRAKRDIARERSLDAALEHSSMRLGAVLSAEQSTPSGRVGAEEQTLRIADALISLPTEEQECIVLRYCQELGLEEIGARLGISRYAAARCLRRGLALLREVLGGSE